MVYIGNLFLILGVLVLIISGLGLLRLPTFLTRIHAAAKSSTLGIIFFFIGISILEPSWAPKLLVAIALFLFTGPISASALARSVLTENDIEKYYPKDSSDSEEESEEVDA